MDNTTLLAALVGGLIATVPVVLSNVVQLIIHNSERNQKEKEAKTQLALELTRNDIKTIEDSINNYLKLIDKLHIIIDKNLPTSRTDEDIAYEYLKEYLTNDNKLHELYDDSAVADKIALSLGEGFFIEYKTYRDKCKNFFKLAISSPSEFINDENSVDSIVRNAGKLHNMLNEKLISLRDA